MTIRRLALQAAIANLTMNQAITVDVNGLLISAGLITYAYIQNVSATDKVLGRVSAGAGVIEEIACTAAGRALIDDADAAAQRTTLGLGTIATQAANNVAITGGSIAGITDLAIADGGTGSGTAAAARLALSLVDANDRMPTAMLPTNIMNSYWHASNDEKTVVAGTWAPANDASQTDFDSLLSPNAGYIVNSSYANNDEIHFGSLTFNAGTYKVIISGMKYGDSAICEILHGTTSLGTTDYYSAGPSYNFVSTFTYTPATRKTGNLRMKCSGKNASSSGYVLRIGRLEIIRTG